MDDQPHTEIRLGDCREIIATLPDCSIDSIVTDPPYELGFMGKKWDASGIAYDITLWEQCLRVLKPGGHLLAFGGTRTYHRMTCAIEDAGFEIRDCIVWLYSSGFPKSHNLKNDWDGWGTALKPANEPIVLARKPLAGTVADNVQQHGTGALNIDATRIDMGDEYDPDKVQRQQHSAGAIDGAFGAASLVGKEIPTYNAKGRWPANVIANENMNEEWVKYFFTPKASRTERNAGLGVMRAQFAPTMNNGIGGKEHDPETAAEKQNTHPTVKPLALMRYLVRLITPPGGTVLEPFAGSGTTLMAAVMEGCNAIGCEITDEYIEIIERRVRWAREQHTNQQTTLFGDTDG
jgi:site-specific DNA-methyltransferase (adenine-specific)